MTQFASVTEFVNTLDLTHGYDVLQDQGRLAAWLASRGSQPDEVPAMHDVALAVEVREAIRDLLGMNSGSTPSPASWEVVGRVSRMVSVSLEVETGHTAIRPAGAGLLREVASVIVAMHSAMADGTWSRIKICRNPDCRWAFYDRSRNHARVWCTMAECGNRMKARRFRRRRVPQAVSGPSSSGEPRSGEE